jgi:hypothetical protein
MKRKPGSKAEPSQWLVSGGAVQKSLAELRKQLFDPTTNVDELTRDELLSAMKPTADGKNLAVNREFGRPADLLKMFEQAKEGVLPKFKARAQVQAMYNTMVSSPDSQRLRGLLDIGSKVRF